jgi:hypothetical protein
MSYKVYLVNNPTLFLTSLVPNGVHDFDYKSNLYLSHSNAYVIAMYCNNKLGLNVGIKEVFVLFVNNEYIEFVNLELALDHKRFLEFEGWECRLL